MFSGPLKVAIAKGERERIAATEGEFIVQTRYGPVAIPHGFWTDFASIPRVLRFIVDRLGAHAYGAVPHDWVCRTHQLTRKQADQIFYDCMVAAGVAPWKCWLMWAAVRVGGRRGWENEAKDFQETAMKNEPRWLTAARKDIGVQEEAGAGTNPRVAAMLAAAGLAGHDDSTPWCGCAMTAWMREAGITVPPASARARAWVDWGTPLAKPVPGCIAIYTRTNDPMHGHVALFLSSDGGKDSILGGNQSDGVTITRMAASRILGYRWPPGEPAPGTPIKTAPTTRIEDAKQSTTVTGGLIALVGAAVQWGSDAIAILTEAAARATELTPVKSMMMGMGGNAKSIGFAIGAAGVVLVIAKRLGTDSKKVTP